MVSSGMNMNQVSAKCVRRTSAAKLALTHSFTSEDLNVMIDDCFCEVIIHLRSLLFKGTRITFELNTRHSNQVERRMSNFTSKAKVLSEITFCIKNTFMK